MLTIEKKSLKVGKFVDTAHVDTVIRNYKQERWVQNSQRIGKEDSLSVWYSLEEVEEFLAKAKEHGADGVRLYFGVYSADFKERPVCAGRQTVVFVATKHKDGESNFVNKDIYIPTENGSSILAFNVGMPCPPYCPNTEGRPRVGTTIVDKGEDGLVVA